MQALVDLVCHAHPRTVLDVGCGEGLVPRQLRATWNEVEIRAVDISLELILVARQLTSSASHVAGSTYHPPLPDYHYDLVICTEVLEHLENPETALAEIARVGKGYGLLSVPHEPWWRIANVMSGSYLGDWGNTPGHVNHWSEKGFIKFVDNYLDIVAVRQPFPWTMVLGRVRPMFQL
jgi:ubiquinone/menaquinone biosynthesis C-methylase UbiE